MMDVRKISLWRADGGTSMVEFGLILPMIALLLLGLIETGRYAAFSIRVSNAARAGAQFGQQDPAHAQGPDPATGIPYVDEAACNDSGFTCAYQGNPPPNTLLVTSSTFCTFSDGTPDASCLAPPQGSPLLRREFVQVNASANFTPLVNYPLLPASVPVSATATMQVSE